MFDIHVHGIVRWANLRNIFYPNVNPADIATSLSPLIQDCTSVCFPQDPISFVGKVANSRPDDICREHLQSDLYSSLKIPYIRNNPLTMSNNGGPKVHTTFGHELSVALADDGLDGVFSDGDNGNLSIADSKKFVSPLHCYQPLQLSTRYKRLKRFPLPLSAWDFRTPILNFMQRTREE